LRRVSRTPLALPKFADTGRLPRYHAPATTEGRPPVSAPGGRGKHIRPLRWSGVSAVRGRSEPAPLLGPRAIEPRRGTGRVSPRACEGRSGNGRRVWRVRCG